MFCIDKKLLNRDSSSDDEFASAGDREKLNSRLPDGDFFDNTETYFIDEGMLFDCTNDRYRNINQGGMTSSDFRSGCMITCHS